MSKLDSAGLAERAAEQGLPPRPEPIGKGHHGRDEYWLDELVKFRLSRGVTQAQVGTALGMSQRSVNYLETDRDGTGRTDDHRARDYLVAVERYVRGREVMYEHGRGIRTRAEADAIRAAQRAEEAAPGYNHLNDGPTRLQLEAKADRERRAAAYEAKEERIAAEKLAREREGLGIRK